MELCKILNLTEAECWSEFRFYRTDIYRLQQVFQIPDVIHTNNRLLVDGIEALCIFLKRFSYPCRYSEMIPRFGRPVPQYSIISIQIMNHIFMNFGHLLEDLNQPWLSRANLESFAHAVHSKRAALDHCWGFVDGTVRPVCRPNQMQRAIYNGHKKVHAIKFQSVVAPNGLIENLYGPMEGKRHDAGMLRDSQLLQKLQQYSFNTQGQPLCIYGDPAYPLRVHLQCPFQNAVLTPPQRDFNKSMSKVRVSVEWVFGDIVNWFAFLDLKKTLKLDSVQLGKCTLHVHY